MKITLPPGTHQYAQTGTLSICLTTTYLNTPVRSIKYALTLWGISEDVILDPLFSKGPEGSCQSHKQTFAITTNLSKLTSYFNDMGVLIINAKDARTQKQIGTGYVKLKRYIVNGFLTQFDENVEILSPYEHKQKKATIGEVVFTLNFNVPQQKLSKNQHEKQTIRTGKYENKQAPQQKSSIFPNIEALREAKQNQRKIVVQQHVFEEKSDSNHLNQFLVNTIPHKQPEKSCGRLQKLTDVNQEARGLGRKSKINILEFLDEDSICKYPDIQDLTKKYGRNSVCAERMRLKLDEAKYLDSRKEIMEQKKLQNIRGNGGYLIKCKNMNLILPTTLQLDPIHITLFQSERDPKILAQLAINIKEGVFYIKNLTHGNLFQFQNRLFKGKIIINRVNLSGEVLKVYLKRKDNNKKAVEFDMVIQNLSGVERNEKNVKENELKRQDDVKDSQQHHFYLSIRPVLENRGKHYIFTLHPECEKRAVKGRKMIFTAYNKQQFIKIHVETNSGLLSKDIIATADPSIKMKEEIVSLENQKFRLFLASADSLQNLMKIVTIYDIESKNYPSGHTNDNCLQKQQFQGRQASRQQRLKVLFECFKHLLWTNNSECMELIQKLMLPAITSEQQINLFSKLCSYAGMGDSSKDVSQAFQSLLHGQFSMFWSCFEFYKLWNQLYWHALELVRNEFYMLLKELLVYSEGASQLFHHHQKTSKKMKTLMEKAIQKLYRQSETLFGLISCETCELVLNSFFLSYFQKQPEINASNHQQQKEIRTRKLTELLEKIRNALYLMCRYLSKAIKNSQKHCVKIDELATFFFVEIVEDNRIFLNWHQILAISGNSKNQEKQTHLLYQIVNSCVGDINCQGHCGNLKIVLNEYRGVTAEESSRVESSVIRTKTSKDHNRKINTQGQERVETEEVFQYKKNTQSDVPKMSEAEFAPIKLYFTEVKLNKNSLLVGRSNCTIELFETNLKFCVQRMKEQELPKYVNLKPMHEYEVVLTINMDGLRNAEEAEIQTKPANVRLGGLFIATSRLEKILLYGGDEKLCQVGWIGAAVKLPEAQPQNEEEIAVIVEDIISFKKQSRPPTSARQEQEHQHAVKLTKQGGSKVLTCPIFWYNILSICPPPRSTDQYLVEIFGAPQIIRYPEGAAGKIINCDPSSQQMDITIHSLGTGAKLTERLHKTTGIHQICFNRWDGTVGYVCTVELDEYRGDETVDNCHSLLQRVIMLNVYHMESIEKIDAAACFTLVVTTQSSEEPVFVRDFSPSSRSSEKGSAQFLRSTWIGLSIRLDISNKYHIYIYRIGKAKKKKYSEESLTAHFQFKMKFHNDEVGIFTNKGYLRDKSGYRLAITGFQFNYNDIFSQNPIGRSKFQNLLSVFTVENILRLKKACKSPHEIQSSLRSCFRFNNTQIYLLLSLQKHDEQLFNIITNWDIAQLPIRQTIDLHSYSVEELYSEFQIYDFNSSGMIPRTKLELVDTLIFGKTQSNPHGDCILNTLLNHKQEWAYDFNAPKEMQEEDYLFILWCLRPLAASDNFFFANSASYDQDGQNGTRDETTNLDNNQTLSKIRLVQVSLLSFKNLKINNLPATLTFYINGDKVAEPVPRCFTHEFQSPKVVVTRWPILLQIYNKKYGVRQLYTEELVSSLKVYQEKVCVLGGEIYFMIEEEEKRISTLRGSIAEIDKNSQAKSVKPTKNGISRQDRRERWQNLKKSRLDTNKIVGILST